VNDVFKHLMRLAIGCAVIGAIGCTIMKISEIANNHKRKKLHEEQLARYAELCPYFVERKS
jgi:hypothetical protein